MYKKELDLMPNDGESIFQKKIEDYLTTSYKKSIWIFEGCLALKYLISMRRTILILASLAALSFLLLETSYKSF